MQRRSFLYATASAAVLVAFRNSLSFAKGEPAVPADPLLSPWTGPYGGTPPFNKIKPASFKPALTKAMELKRTELAAIAGTKEAATFDNTIGALEDSGRPFARTEAILGVYTSTLNDKTMQAIEKEVSPVLAAFSDEITQNEPLFARIKAVHDGRKAAKLAPDQLRITEVVYRNFARRGAALGKPQKVRLAEINKQLASLYTTFGQNQLADEEGQTLLLETDADLAGLPDTLRAALAPPKGFKGKAKGVISNTRSSVDPFLTYSPRRDLREKAWRMFISRGDTGAHDNKPVITQILTLRGERAKLLGFASHAHWAADDNMAKTPDAAMALMMKVWKAATLRVREEVADMQKIADAEKANLKIEPWDYRFYAEKVRQAKYDLDQNEVKQYCPLGKMRDAMFWAANQL
ncbi:MAG: M3 family peptidase, partial [Deltaproteobacteria bacterium]|nr:M3 family peptidase [Deltaproteobacteria bacterium]